MLITYAAYRWPFAAMYGYVNVDGDMYVPLVSTFIMCRKDGNSIRFSRILGKVSGQ